MEHLGSRSIYHGEGHFSAIMRGIDVHAKGTLAEWHAAARAVSAGWPACAKWFVPSVNAPGTTIEVSIPHRVNSHVLPSSCLVVCMGWSIGLAIGRDA